MSALVITGTASGVGKTTVTAGLIAVLRCRGLRVQPFKVGPDYIDPTFHTLAAGRACRNLDSWLVSPTRLRHLYARAAADSDVAIVEGVMGLFDGRTGAGDVGSTAHVAKLLGIPVVLVVDAAKTARSAAAVVLGFRQFDTAIELAGVILNNVASPAHYAAVAEPIVHEAGVPVLGWLGRDGPGSLPERYLGLIPATERRIDSAWLEKTAGAVADGVAVDHLLRIAGRASRPTETSDLFPESRMAPAARLAVAQDEAFHFYYQDNLDLLQAWGAELVPFSPLHDDRLPADTHGVYVGGGFPELFAADLAANREMLRDVREAASTGMPIYGECGGLMWLADGLVAADGKRHPMAGVVAGWSSMERGRLTLGYRELRARQDSILMRAGERARGHEFHWSAVAPPPAARAAYEIEANEPRLEGFARDNVLASYVHLHFGSDARLAPRFVEACRRFASDGATATPGTAAPTGAGIAPRPRRLPDTDGEATTPLLQRYGHPPTAIEALSQRRIVERLSGQLPSQEPERGLVTRLVYAAGDPDLASQVVIAHDFVDAAVAALSRGAPIVVDVRMVAAGIDRRAITSRNDLLIAVDAADDKHGRDGQITRTAAGMLALAPRLDGAVVAIGNAPTALLALLDLVNAGRVRPAAVIGMPVGFVAAEESKAALIEGGLPFATVRGTRGGSPLAAAAVNYLLRLAAAGSNEDD